MLCLFFFFFQAEDGIRDAQESGGLGDVYRGQCTSCVRGGWCESCWSVETTAAGDSSRVNMLEPQKAGAPVTVLTVLVAGSTDVVVSPRRVLVLTGPVLGPTFTASRMLTFCVFHFPARHSKVAPTPPLPLATHRLRGGSGLSQRLLLFAGRHSCSGALQRGPT